MENKILTLSVAAVALSVSACGSIPECQQELSECGFGAPYTEERTVQADKRVPMPEPAPVMVEEKVVVIEEPTPPPPPTPVVVDDTPIMTTAEPQFKQISK